MEKSLFDFSPRDGLDGPVAPIEMANAAFRFDSSLKNDWPSIAGLLGLVATVMLTLTVAVTMNATLVDIEIAAMQSQSTATVQVANK